MSGLDHSVSQVGHAPMSKDGAEADILPRRSMRRLVSLNRATPWDRQQDRASYLLQNFLHQQQHPPDLSVSLVGLMHA